MTTNDILDEMRHGAILCMGWFEGEKQFWLELPTDRPLYKKRAWVRIDVGERLVSHEQITPQQDTLFPETMSQSFVLKEAA